MLWHFLIVVALVVVIAAALKCVHVQFPNLFRKRSLARDSEIDLEEGSGLAGRSSSVAVGQTSSLPIVHKTKSQMTITILPPTNQAPLTEFQKLCRNQTSQCEDDDSTTTRCSSDGGLTRSSSKSSRSTSNEDATTVYGVESLGHSSCLQYSSSLSLPSVSKSSSMGHLLSAGSVPSLGKATVRPFTVSSRSSQQATQFDDPILCTKEKLERPLARTSCSDADAKFVLPSGKRGTRQELLEVMDRSKASDTAMASKRSLELQKKTSVVRHKRTSEAGAPSRTRMSKQMSLNGDRKSVV